VYVPLSKALFTHSQPPVWRACFGFWLWYFEPNRATTPTLVILEETMQRRTNQLLAALTTTLLLASVGISSASAYTPVPLPDYADNNAGLVLDSTMPSDYTISIAGGGVALGGSMDSAYFNLENCKSATQIYCIVGAKVDGKALSFVRATEAPMLSSVGQEVSRKHFGLVRWLKVLLHQCGCFLRLQPVPRNLGVQPEC
jgi:hypothetical protein